MSQDFLQKSLYEVLYNNLLLPRTHEIDDEEKREAFDGSTDSLVQLHKENQNSFAQFCKLSQSQISEIIAKSRNFPIDKDRFLAFCDIFIVFIKLSRMS